MNTSEILNKVTPSTPLGVISLFVGVIEIIVTTALIQTSGLVQLLLAIFVLVYPPLIAFAFFYFLWKKPENLIAHPNFANADEAIKYFNAIKGLANEAKTKNDEISELFVKTKIIFDSTEDLKKRFDEQVEKMAGVQAAANLALFKQGGL